MTVYALIKDLFLGLGGFSEDSENHVLFGEWRINWTSKGSEDVPDHRFTPAKKKLDHSSDGILWVLGVFCSYRTC